MMTSTAAHFSSLHPTVLLAWTFGNFLVLLVLAFLWVRWRKGKGHLPPPLSPVRSAVEPTSTGSRNRQPAETQVYHLLDREQAQVRRLENLRTASANIMIEVTLGGLLKSVTGNAAVLLDAEACEVLLFNPEMREVFHTSSETTDMPALTGSQVLETIQKTGRASLLNASPVPASGDQTPAYRSLIAVPLLIRKQMLGILAVSETRRESPFSPDDLQLLELLAQQSAIAIQNAELFEEVNRLAVTDGLTGIFNHRQVVTLALQELERAKRYKMPFSIFMFDIDHFKQINDRYGHVTGDQVLHWLAQTCKNVIRFNDTIGRYGGEEFLVLLPNTPFSAGMQCAERLRQKVDQAVFENEQYRLSITISLGIATWTQQMNTVESLLEAADQALYHSKQAGRNRVTGLDTVGNQFILYPTADRG